MPGLPDNALLSQPRSRAAENATRTAPVAGALARPAPLPPHYWRTRCDSQSPREVLTVGSVLGGNEICIDDVAVDMCGLDAGEAGVMEHLPGLLLAPHGTETHSAFGERNRHAVHA